MQILFTPGLSKTTAGWIGEHVSGTPPSMFFRFGFASKSFVAACGGFSWGARWHAAPFGARRLCRRSEVGWCL